MIKLCPLYVRYLTSTGPLVTCHALKRKREKEYLIVTVSYCHTCNC